MPGALYIKEPEKDECITEITRPLVRYNHHLHKWYIRKNIHIVLNAISPNLL